MPGQHIVMEEDRYAVVDAEVEQCDCGSKLVDECDCAFDPELPAFLRRQAS